MNQHRPDLSRAEFLHHGALGLGLVATSALAPARLLAAPSMTPASASPSPVFDLREFERWVIHEFEPSVRRAGGAGHYARAPDQTDVELYGVADMACVLHTLGLLRPSLAERAEWAAAFAPFQREEDGWLREKNPSHGPMHNLAFGLAGMELLDLKPARPVRMAPEHADPRAYLATLDWKTRVYPESHQGAGIGAVYALLPELGGAAWMDAYFSACDDLFDPNNGLMGRDKPAGGDFDAIGGTFHYVFLYHHFNRRAPFPRERIDAVLGNVQPNGYWRDDNKLWLSFDALYLLTRTLRYCPHRYEDVVACARQVMTNAVRDIFSPEGRAQTFSKRVTTHSVAAALCLAAEAQLFLGSHEVVTERPLRLVLDRRPFI